MSRPALAGPSSTSSYTAIDPHRVSGPSPAAGPSSTSASIPAHPASSGQAPPVKRKRKRPGDVNDTQVSQKKSACDACKSRKVKCERTPALPDNYDYYSATVPIPPCKASPTRSSRNCSALDIDCTYHVRVRRRGPPNQYVIRLREQAAAAAASAGLEAADSGDQEEDHFDPASSFPSHPSFAGHDRHRQSSSSSSNETVSTPAWSHAPAHFQSGSFTSHGHLSHPPPPHPLPPHPPLASGSNSFPSTSTYPGTVPSHTIELLGYQTAQPLTSSLDMLASFLPPDSKPDLHAFPSSSSPGKSSSFGAAHSTWASVETPSGDGTGLAGGDEARPSFLLDEAEGDALSATNSVAKVHKVEDVISRSTAAYVLQLFFDFVHPLTPCIHGPTFLEDFHHRREESSPLWFALLMSVLAATLVQVPWSFVPVQKNKVRNLARRCYRASRAVSVDCYDPPTLEMAVLRYMDCVFLSKDLTHRNDASANCAFGEAHALALTLKLHEEDSYVGLDPVEAEGRRRLYYNVFGADKTMAILLGRPIGLPTQECREVALPTALDDEYITRAGYLTPPALQTPVISGFNVSMLIYSVIGEIVTLQRETRRQRPLGPETIVRKLQEVRKLMSDLGRIPDEMPKAFAIKNNFDSVANSPAEGWDEGLREKLDLFFNDPAVSNESTTAKDKISVCMANIHVTSSLARYALLQYRDELLGYAGPEGSSARNAAERVAYEHGSTLDRKEQVAIDLLDALNSIPVHSLAVNGPSLVDRIRFVASTLLENKDGDERIVSYLFSFFEVLAGIEKHFAQGEDDGLIVPERD